MKPDRLDEMAEQLFASARRECPDRALIERVLSLDELAAKSTAALETTSERPGAGLPGRRGTAGRRFTPWLLAAAVLGGLTLWVLLDTTSIDVRLSPERWPTASPRSSVPVPIVAETPHSTESPAARNAIETEAPKPSERPHLARSSAPTPRGPSAPPAGNAAEPSRTGAALPPAVPPAHPPATLSTELSLLEQARTALRRGDGTSALGLLDRYDSELHGTDLIAEATLLRLEALASVGRRADAAELARSFVAANPNSPLADRAQRFSVRELSDRQPQGPSRESSP